MKGMCMDVILWALASIAFLASHIKIYVAT